MQELLDPGFKKFLSKLTSYIITGGFLLFITGTIISWYFFTLQNGFTLNATLYFGIPGYSPHNFDILLFSLVFLVFFRRQYGIVAIGYFLFAVCFSEVLGNANYYGTLITNPTLAFSNITPFQGWIYWDKIIIWWIVSLAAIILLKPKFEIKKNWQLIFPGLFLFGGTTLMTLLSTFQEWELCVNAIYLAAFLTVTHKK